MSKENENYQVVDNKEASVAVADNAIVADAFLEYMMSVGDGAPEEYNFLKDDFALDEEDGESDSDAIETWEDKGDDLGVARVSTDELADAFLAETQEAGKGTGGEPQGEVDKGTEEEAKVDAGAQDGTKAEEQSKKEDEAPKSVKDNGVWRGVVLDKGAGQEATEGMREVSEGAINSVVEDALGWASKLPNAGAGEGGAPSGQQQAAQKQQQKQQQEQAQEQAQEPAQGGASTGTGASAGAGAGTESGNGSEGVQQPQAAGGAEAGGAAGGGTSDRIKAALANLKNLFVQRQGSTGQAATQGAAGSMAGGASGSASAGASGAGTVAGAGTGSAPNVQEQLGKMMGSAKSGNGDNAMEQKFYTDPNPDVVTAQEEFKDVKSGDVYTDSKGRSWEWTVIPFSVVSEKTKDTELDDIADAEGDEIGSGDEEDGGSDKSLNDALEVALAVLNGESAGGPGSGVGQDADDISGLNDDRNPLHQQKTATRQSERDGNQDRISKSQFTKPWNLTKARTGYGVTKSQLPFLSPTAQKRAKKNPDGSAWVPSYLAGAAKSGFKKASETHRRNVAGDYEKCRAKDPARCPYHGAAYLTAKLGECIRAAGYVPGKFVVRMEDSPVQGQTDRNRYALCFALPEGTPLGERMKIAKALFATSPGIMFEGARGKDVTQEHFLSNMSDYDWSQMAFNVLPEEGIDDIPEGSMTLEEEEATRESKAEVAQNKRPQGRGATSWTKFDELSTDDQFAMLAERPKNIVSCADDIMRYARDVPEFMPDGIDIEEVRAAYNRFQEANAARQGLQAFDVEAHINDAADYANNYLKMATDAESRDRAAKYLEAAQEIYALAEQIMPAVRDSFIEWKGELKKEFQQNYKQRAAKLEQGIYIGSAYKVKKDKKYVVPLNPRGTGKANEAYGALFRHLHMLENQGNCDLWTGCETREPTLVFQAMNQLRNNLLEAKLVLEKIGKMQDDFITNEMTEQQRKDRGIRVPKKPKEEVEAPSLFDDEEPLGEEVGEEEGEEVVEEVPNEAGGEGPQPEGSGEGGEGGDNGEGGEEGEGKGEGEEPVKPTGPVEGSEGDNGADNGNNGDNGDNGGNGNNEDNEDNKGDGDEGGEGDGNGNGAGDGGKEGEGDKPVKGASEGKAKKSEAFSAAAKKDPQVKSLIKALNDAKKQHGEDSQEYKDAEAALKTGLAEFAKRNGEGKKPTKKGSKTEKPVKGENPVKPETPVKGEKPAEPVKAEGGQTPVEPAKANKPAQTDKGAVKQPSGEVAKTPVKRKLGDYDKSLVNAAKQALSDDAEYQKKAAEVRRLAREADAEEAQQSDLAAQKGEGKKGKGKKTDQGDAPFKGEKRKALETAQADLSKYYNQYLLDYCRKHDEASAEVGETDQDTLKNLTPHGQDLHFRNRFLQVLGDRENTVKEGQRYKKWLMGLSDAAMAKAKPTPKMDETSPQWYTLTPEERNIEEAANKQLEFYNEVLADREAQAKKQLEAPKPTEVTAPVETKKFTYTTPRKSWANIPRDQMYGKVNEAVGKLPNGMTIDDLIANGARVTRWEDRDGNERDVLGFLDDDLALITNDPRHPYVQLDQLYEKRLSGDMNKVSQYKQVVAAIENEAHKRNS